MPWLIFIARIWVVFNSSFNSYRKNILVWHSNKLAVLDYPIQYGYIIEATISYYPIRNGWKLWYGKNGLFYYKTIQDCWSYDLQNIGLKIHNFSLELKQSKTLPAVSCWIISTLVSVSHGIAPIPLVFNDRISAIFTRSKFQTHLSLPIPNILHIDLHFRYLNLIA